MTSPKLLSVTATNSTTITLHFDRAVSAGEGNIVVSDGYSQSYVGSRGLSSRIVGANDTRTIDDDDSQLTYSGRDIVIHLSSPLQSGVAYSVTMSAGTVLNGTDGNAGISSTKLFGFTAAGNATVVATPSAAVASVIHFTDTGASTTDYITASRDQVVSGSYTGTLGSNDFVQVSLDNGASWHKATVNTSTKTWSYEGVIDTANLTHGAGNAFNGALLARVSNTAGGSSASASQSYVYSNTPIEINVNSTVSLSPDTGVSGTDLITKTAAQTISGIYQGTLQFGQTLQVSVDGGSHWVNATAAQGNWQASVTLLEGEHELQMRVTDAAGNTSGIAYNEYTLISSGATLAGRALALSAGSDSGASSSDGVTNNASSVTLNVAGLYGIHAGDVFEIVDTSNGSAVVGSYTVQYGDLYYGGDYLSLNAYTSTARTTLDIGLDAPLSNGSHQLAVRLVDIAGNTGIASGTTTVVADTSAPVISSSAPVEGATSVGTGLSTLTFTFNENIVIAAGTQITISDDNNPNNLQQVTLSAGDVSGKTLTIHLASPLAAGTHYTVKGAAIGDLAGNIGITGDNPLLHFVTAGVYNGGAPDPLAIGYVDTAPASDTNATSAWHTDGVTNDNHITVTGVAQNGVWYYRTSANGAWTQGDNGGFTLADGSYAMDQIQIKQTVNGVDSQITSISVPLVVDTQASGATVAGTNAFAYGDNSISGALSGSTDLPNDIVQITLDHGATWLQASTTYVGTGAATWTLSGIAAQLGTSYGLRLSDQVGNLTPFANQGSATTTYYLTNGDNSFNYANDNHIVVIGGNGNDYIAVGDDAYVIGNSGGGAGDTIHTGDNAVVSANNNATISTGNGNNLVSTGHSANITTGSGDDTIAVSVVDNATIHAGAGNDHLIVNVTSTLVLENLNVTGVDVFTLDGSGANSLTINGAAGVRGFSDSGTLTITAAASGSAVHLNGSVWTAGAAQGMYQTYHAGSGEVLLIGQNITVDTLVGSA